jgi:hypothetical protein
MSASQAQGPLLALFGRHNRTLECLLLGEERKSRLRRSTSESDPSRTLALAREQPAKKANNLAPVSREHRMKVLHGANQAVAAHILVSLAIKVVGDACDNLLCQAGPRRGLEEGQPI